MPLRLTVARAAAASVLLVSALAHPPSVQAQALSGNGFLFGQPNGSVTLRGGLALPNAGGDVFDHARSNLTLDKGDFVGGSFIADINVRLADRLSLQLTGGYSGRTVGSEFRDWVDNDNNPIEQSTTLRRVPLMMGLRYDLGAPGRSLGRIAWVPSRITPYVSAGAGAMWYDYKENGDFFDDSTLEVFHSTFQSRSWAPAAYGAVGADFTLGPMVSLSTEARYDEARGKPGRDFPGFSRIDLSGLAVTAGLSFRY